MAKRRGKREKTRRKLKKSPRDKTTPNQFLKEFEKGENARIKIEPSSHKGMPDPRFNGRDGQVIDKRGRAYVVKLKDGGKTKQIIARPEHLSKV